jgi:hypothetical protein
MASQMSTYLQNAVVNVSLRNTAYTAPTTVYVGLFTTTLTAAGTGTEVSGGSYARTAVTLSAPSSGATSNSANVVFPTATASWGTVTYMGIYDAATSGNLLYFSPLTNSKTIDIGDVFQFSTANINVSLA